MAHPSNRTATAAVLRRPSSAARTCSWLAAWLVVGCYDPAKSATDDESTGDGSTGEDASATDTSDASDPSVSSSDPAGSSDDTNPMPSTSLTTSADDSSTDGGDATADESGSSTGEVVDTTAPQILTISPGDGQGGVRSDVTVVITFDEPMAEAATVAALDAADLGPFTASWSDGGATLTIEPDAPLAYAAGTDPADVVALEYVVAIGTEATDVAGNALDAEVVSSFFTARRISTTLGSDATLTGAVRANGVLHTGSGGDATAGDDSGNLERRGFFALVLDDVPADAEVESATLEAQQYLTLGAPFTSLGALGILHITADTLDADAFVVPALADLGVFSDSAADGLRTADIAASVTADLAAGRTRSQYRVQFPIGSDGDAGFDTARYDSPSTGSLVYLIE